MKKRIYQKVALTHFRENSSVFIFVIVLFLMGVIFGAIVVNSMSFTQKEDLFYYLSQFFGQMSNGKESNANTIFFQSILHNSKYIGLMWLLGISIVGLPVILILLFIKGMVVGFTVGFLVNQMGWKGFLLSFVSILPQNIIIIPVFIIMAVITMYIFHPNDPKAVYEKNKYAHVAIVMQYTLSHYLWQLSVYPSQQQLKLISPHHY